MADTYRVKGQNELLGTIKTRKKLLGVIMEDIALCEKKFQDDGTDPDRKNMLALVMTLMHCTMPNGGYKVDENIDKNLYLSKKFDYIAKIIESKLEDKDLAENKHVRAKTKVQEGSESLHFQVWELISIEARMLTLKYNLQYKLNDAWENNTTKEMEKEKKKERKVKEREADERTVSSSSPPSEKSSSSSSSMPKAQPAQTNTTYNYYTNYYACHNLPYLSPYPYHRWMLSDYHRCHYDIDWETRKIGLLVDLIEVVARLSFDFCGYLCSIALPQKRSSSSIPSSGGPSIARSTDSSMSSSTSTQNRKEEKSNKKKAQKLTTRGLIVGLVLLSVAFVAAGHNLKKLVKSIINVGQGYKFWRSMSRIAAAGIGAYAGANYGAVIAAAINTQLVLFLGVVGCSVVVGILGAFLGIVIAKYSAQLISKYLYNDTNPEKYNLTEKQKAELRKNNYNLETIENMLPILRNEKSYYKGFFDFLSPQKVKLNALLQEIKAARCGLIVRIGQETFFTKNVKQKELTNNAVMTNALSPSGVGLPLSYQAVPEHHANDAVMTGVSSSEGSGVSVYPSIPHAYNPASKRYSTSSLIHANNSSLAPPQPSAPPLSPNNNDATAHASFS